MGVNINLLSNLTENMFSLPIEKFDEFFYNGKIIKRAINLDDCTTFANYSPSLQSVEIYKDREVKYSCSIIKIYGIPVITDVFSRDGKIFSVDNGYIDALYEEMKNNAEIMRSYQVNNILEEISNALDEAEQYIKDIKKYGILLDYTNYMYSMGKYHAYMDTLDLIDSDKWDKVAKANMERIDRIEKQSDILYRSLKKTIYRNEYA